MVLLLWTHTSYYRIFRNFAKFYYSSKINYDKRQRNLELRGETPKLLLLGNEKKNTFWD